MSPLDLAVLGAAAFLTSALTAVAGLGGGIVLLAILVLYLEPLVAIPVHGVIQLVSNASRTWIQRRHVQREVLAWFAVLLLPGCFAGLQVLQRIPAAVGKLAIGVFVLVATWLPRALTLGIRAEQLHPRRRFLGLGAFVGFITTTFGAAGPFLGPFFRDLGWPRQQVVGTFAACQTLGHLTKLALFGLAGFAFREHLLLLAITASLVIAGTWVGSQLLERLPEKGFATLYRTVLTLVGIYLVVTNLLPLLR